MVIYKRNLRPIYTSNKTIVKKHVFCHAKGFIETYFTDAYGNKQGLYSLVSRRTKKKIYECFYTNNQKIGIQNIYDENGILIHSDTL